MMKRIFRAQSHPNGDEKGFFFRFHRIHFRFFAELRLAAQKSRRGSICMSASIRSSIAHCDPLVSTILKY